MKISEIDRTNTDPEYWEKILSKYGLSLNQLGMIDESEEDCDPEIEDCNCNPEIEDCESVEYESAEDDDCVVAEDCESLL
jgi:hypothetical protein